MDNDDAFGARIDPPSDPASPHLSPGGKGPSSRPDKKHASGFHYGRELNDALAATGGGDGMGLPPATSPPASSGNGNTASSPNRAASRATSSFDVAPDTGLSRATLSGAKAQPFGAVVSSPPQPDAVSSPVSPAGQTNRSGSVPSTIPSAPSVPAPPVAPRTAPAAAATFDPTPQNDLPAPSAPAEDVPPVDPVLEWVTPDEGISRPETSPAFQAARAESEKNIRENQRRLASLMPTQHGHADYGVPLFVRQAGQADWESHVQAASALLKTLKEAQIDPKAVNAFINLTNAVWQHDTTGFDGIAKGRFSAADLGEQMNDFSLEGTVGMNRLGEGRFSAADLGEQVNDFSLEGTVGGEHLPKATFSLKTAGEQLVDHLHAGTAPIREELDEWGRLQTQLRQTVGGKELSNQVGSAHIGVINFSQTAVRTVLQAMARANPPDTAMEQFRAWYEQSEADPRAFVEQIQGQHQLARGWEERIDELAQKGRSAYRSIQSEGHRNRQWLTTDPARAVYTHPGRAVGYCLEELVPSLLAAQGMGKILKEGGLSQAAQFGVKGYWVGHTSYVKGYEKTREYYRRHPEALKADAAYQRYVRESEGTEAEKRQAYLEAKAVKAGITAAVLGVVTYITLNGFQRSTRTGDEGKTVLVLQQALNTIGLSITKEIADAAQEANFDSNRRARE